MCAICLLCVLHVHTYALYVWSVHMYMYFQHSLCVMPMSMQQLCGHLMYQVTYMYMYIQCMTRQDIIDLASIPTLEEREVMRLVYSICAPVYIYTMYVLCLVCIVWFVGVVSGFLSFPSWLVCYIHVHVHVHDCSYI